jgi:hypothetical protein
MARDLVGGGIIRFQGGWSAVRVLRVGPVFILRTRIVVVKNEDATLTPQSFPIVTLSATFFYLTIDSVFSKISLMSGISSVFSRIWGYIGKIEKNTSPFRFQYSGLASHNKL